MRFLLSLALSLTTLFALIPSTSAGEAHGWLGLSLAKPDDASGVLVRGVVEGSPADDAHFRAKDAVLAVDGAAVNSPSELMARIQGLEPGSFVTFSVRRGERELELRSILAARPPSMSMVRGWLGVEGIELPASLRAHYGAPGDAGILVSDVSEGSPAFLAGIRVGDVIYEADGHPITTLQELSRFTSEAGVENDMEVVLARDGARIVVSPTIERAPAP